MAHNLEVFADGSASMFSARETPWHHLGVVTDGAVTAQEALKLARLDWEVTKHPVQTVIADADGVSTVDIPNRFATVRTSPETGRFEPLGVVGKDYTVVQNWENADFLNALVDESGAVFETAGSLAGGRRVFLTMKMPNQILVAGVDAINEYIVATNAHDGTASFQVMTTPIRVVCQNTLNVALASKNKISLQHTSRVTSRIQEAREALKLSFRYMDDFQEMAEKLIEKQISDDKFMVVVDKLWEPTLDAKKGEPTKLTVDRRLALKSIFTGSPTCEVGRGTAWAAFNAITEYTDWYAPEWKNGTTRAQRIASGSLDNTKDRALGLLLRTR
jgi:phage/plasmid-like protein (TIGR03299 family)